MFGLVIVARKFWRRDIGTRTGDNVALTLQPPGGAPLALNAFFFTDHVMRGSLTGPGFPGDSVLVFRQ